MSGFHLRRFRPRALVSFGLLFSFLVTVVAGIIMYLRPEGSLASWARWNILGIDKKGWEGVHTLFVILFLLFAFCHLLLNGRSLFRYIKKKTSEGIQAKAEFGIALGISVLLFLAVVNRWQPFWKVIDLRSAIKDGKYSVATTPPAVNAEELPLTELGELTGIPGDEALSRLRSAGMIAAGGRSTLAEIADKHGTSPEKLYRIISTPGKEGADLGKPRQDGGFVTVIGSWTTTEDGAWIADATQWSGQTTPRHLKEVVASLWAPGASSFIKNGMATGAFPLLVFREVTDFSEGTLRVQFKLIGGKSDQTAGIAFNLKPTGDYMFVRYNTKEGNAALWEYTKGKRRVIARGSSTALFPLETWHEIAVTITGKKVIGKIDDTLAVGHELESPVEGRVGLWTKRDSRTSFREFRVESIR